MTLACKDRKKSRTKNPLSTMKVVTKRPLTRQTKKMIVRSLKPNKKTSKTTQYQQTQSK